MSVYSAQPLYVNVLNDIVNNRYRQDQATGLQVINGDRSPGCADYTDPNPHIRLFGGSEGIAGQEIDNQTVVSQTIFPNGRSLSLLYTQYGDVAQINLPTGAYLQYDYGNLGNLPAGNTPSQEWQAQLNSLGAVIDREVTAKRAYDTGGTLLGSWTYTYAPQTPSNSQTQSSCADVLCTDGATGQQLLHQRHFFMPAGRYLSYGLNTGLKGQDGSGYN